MNDQLPQQYAEPAQQLSSTSSLVLDPQAMHSMMALADIMSKAVATVPAHFRGKPGDCLAVVMQAMQWGMNPYAIAQKTHLTPGGQLGYEAQLISAVITGCGALVTQPEYEFLGDWSKILGKVTEKIGEKGGKYYVSTWKLADEEGLGVIVRARLRNEKEPRSLTVMMSQAYPRFSTQWATDPQQQITYLAIRKFGRRYAPGAILGVYVPEELEERQSALPEGIERATADDKKQAIDPDAAKRAELIKRLEAAAESDMAKLTAEFGAIGKEGRVLVGTAEWERIKKLVVPTKTVEPEPAADQKKLPTYAEIMESIKAETSVEILGAIANSITHLPEDQQRELVAAITKKVAQLSGGAE